MIGIIVVTHNQLGDALIESAQFVLGRAPEALSAVSVCLKDDPEAMRKKIAAAIKNVNQKNGILLLTDMFGGTPSNLSYSFLDEGRIEVLSGVNLPILIKAINAREKQALPDLVHTLEKYGKRSISVASGILKGKPRE